MLWSNAAGSRHERKVLHIVVIYRSVKCNKSSQCIMINMHIHENRNNQSFHYFNWLFISLQKLLLKVLEVFIVISKDLLHRMINKLSYVKCKAKFKILLKKTLWKAQCLWMCTAKVPTIKILKMQESQMKAKYHLTC